MEKLKLQSWAESSGDDSSATEEEFPKIVPSKDQLLASISSSLNTFFQFKLENLPYSLTSPEEIHCFFSLSSEEISVRLQYKGQKFTGFALLDTNSKEAALQVSSKYGSFFNTRPLLLYLKQPNGCWFPQKQLLKTKSLATNDENTNCFKTKQKQRTAKSFTGTKVLMKNDQSILSARKSRKACRLLFN